MSINPAETCSCIEVFRARITFVGSIEQLTLASHFLHRTNLYLGALKTNKTQMSCSRRLEHLGVDVAAWSF